MPGKVVEVGCTNHGCGEDDFHCLHVTVGSAFIGCELDQSLIYYVGRVDRRLRLYKVVHETPCNCPCGKAGHTRADPYGCWDLVLARSAKAALAFVRADKEYQAYHTGEHATQATRLGEGDALIDGDSGDNLPWMPPDELDLELVEEKCLVAPSLARWMPGAKPWPSIFVASTTAAYEFMSGRAAPQPTPEIETCVRAFNRRRS